MGLEKNLHLRGRIYYLRLAIPKHLQQLRRAHGKRSPASLWKSLGTSDPALARQRVCQEKARLLTGFEREAAALRKGQQAPLAECSQSAHLSAPDAEHYPRSSHDTASHLRAHSASERDPCTASATVKRGERLIDWFERYLAEEHAGVVGRTLRDKRATARRFVEVAGNKPVTAYTQADISAFKRMLLQCPANVERLFPGMKLPAAIKANAKAGHPLLAPNTVNNKLSTLAAFGTWLECNADQVRAESFRTSPVRDRRPDQRMAPFTDDEVAKILNAPAFSGCESERNQMKPGGHRIRDWRFWIPRIAAFTGARLGEVAQLKPEDVIEQDGRWFISFTDQGDGQSLKTSTSRRTVPMHEALVSSGLPELSMKVRATGGDFLFSEISMDSDGRRATAAGKWFRKFIARLGVGAGCRGAMHRFRHTVVTKLRKAGFEDHQIAPLVGHGVDLARMTSGYGDVVRRPEQLVQMIDAISYP